MFNTLSLSILGGLVTGTLTFFSFKVILGFTFREIHQALKRPEIQINSTETSDGQPLRIGHMVTLYMDRYEPEHHAVREFNSVSDNITTDRLPLVSQKDLHHFNCQIFLN